MAMLGAGDTACAAVPVMAHAFALKEIHVTSRTPASRESYAKEIGKEYSLNVRPVESTEKRSKAPISSSRRRQRPRRSWKIAGLAPE